MAKAQTLYQIEQSRDNPNHYKVVKLDEDYEVLETYHISVIGETGSSSMICTCPAGTREKGCRHRTMMQYFKREKLLGTKWSFNWDKNQWVAPLGSLNVDD